MKLIEFFDRTSIINLPERPDRRKETDEEFRTLAWTIDNEKVAYSNAIRPKAPDGFPSIGAHGCFLSHLEILEEALANNDEHVLILEDDVSFSSKLPRYEEQVVEKLASQPWDFCYLGHDLIDAPDDGLSLTLSDWMVQGCHFYAVQRRVLARLIEFLQAILLRPPGHPDGGPMHFDGAISEFRRRNPSVTTLLVQPNLGFQRPSRTDIHPQRFFDTWPVLSSLTAYLRRMKYKWLKTCF